MIGAGTASKPLRAAPSVSPPHISLKSERGRSINPQNPGFRPSRIFPPVRRGTLEIQAVAGFQPIMSLIVQPDLKFTTQDVKKFLAFVRVGFTTAASGFHSEKMRLH